MSLYSIKKLPTLLLGYIHKPGRLERMVGPMITDRAKIPDGPGLVVWAPPYDGWFFTHLQKYSRWGFLLTWPFCFHFYLTFKFQEGNDTDGWVPGSEKVLYFRTPGYRADPDFQGVKWTWGYLGLHFD